MADIDRQTRDAFGNVSGPMMPPRAEDASLPQEKRLNLENVPGLERPLKAGPNDVVVGEDELGNLIYYNPINNFKYTVKLNPDQRTGRQKFEDDVLPEVKNYLTDPTLPSGEQVLDFGKNVVTGAYDALEGAVSGEGTYGDLLDAASIGVAGKQVFKGKSPKTDTGIEGVTPEEFLSPPLEIDVTDLFKSPTMNPDDWFDSQLLNLEDQLSWVGPSLKEGVEAKLTAINTLGKDQLLALAESMPHYNDPNLTDYNSNLNSIADNLGIYPPHLKEFISDLSIVYPNKPDPGLQDLTETNLPTEAPIGERGKPTAKARPSDKKAEALGFKDTVYHTTTDTTDFTEFDVDQNPIGFGKAPQDYLGVHVGTPRAAAERNFALGATKENPFGSTLELRARTDKPLTGEGLAEIMDLSPEDYHLGLTKGPFTEEEISYFISDYEDKLVQEKPNLFSNTTMSNNPKRIAAKALRKKLAEKGYTHIPYINNVEDAGSTSFIMLVDRPKDSPAVLRDVRAKFDPKKIADPDLRFAEGGLTKNTMEQQMNKLFAEGGINTQETNVDPVSGNEVPPGSLPSEVRDDIDAKLSGGEYVVPADVLRFFGVAFFEDLRRKAKEGLAEMDSDGRIGGGVPEKEEEDFPFSVEELEVEDDMSFAEGGIVPDATPKTTFNPNDWSYDSSMGLGNSTGPTEVKKFKDKNGNIVNVLFINGRPVVDVKSLGYTEYTEETPVATGEKVATPEVQRESSSDRDTSPPPERKPIDPAENYYNLAAENLLNPDYSTLKDTKGAGTITKIGTAFLGPGVALGAGAINSFQQAQNLADARARQIIAKERNLDTTALEAQIKKMEEDASGFVKTVDLVGLDGTGIAKRHKNDLGGQISPATLPVSGGVTSPTGSGLGSGSGGRSSSDDRDSPAAPSLSYPSSVTENRPPAVSPTSTSSTNGQSVVSYPTSISGSGTTNPRSSNPTDYSLGTTTPNSAPSGSVSSLNTSYGTTGTGRGGRARGGLVEKPQKVAKLKTTRKTKI
jgi:hypothetical protein